MPLQTGRECSCLLALLQQWFPLKCRLPAIVPVKSLGADIVPVKSLGVDGIHQCGSVRSAGCRYSAGNVG